MNQRFSDPKYIQIDSLKQYFPTVKEITRDTIYEITLLTPKRQNLQLRITLAPDFPRTTPILTISPPVLHRFVDNQQHINILPIAHENLQRWNVNSSLGKVVYEIVQKFMQEPPQILNSSLPSMNNYPPSLNNPPSNSLPSTINPTMMNPSTNSFISTQNILSNENNTLHTPLPVIPSSFPEIESKSLTELTQLMNDEFEFQKFFESLSTVQTMKKVRDDLRVSNEELAKKNFSKEVEIENIKKEIMNIKEIVFQKKKQFDEQSKHQQEIVGQYSTSALIEKLGEAANEAEKESDLVAEKYLNGEIDHKDFIKEFMEKRKLYHLRAAKREHIILSSAK